MHPSIIDSLGVIFTMVTDTTTLVNFDHQKFYRHIAIIFENIALTVYKYITINVIIKF